MTIFITLYKTVLSLSLMGSILTAAILLFKFLFRNRLGAAWHYYIWLLLVLRLVVPFTPQIPVSSLNLANPFVLVTQKMGVLQEGIKGADAVISPSNPADKISAATESEKNFSSTALQVEQKVEEANGAGRSLPVDDRLLSILWAGGGLIILFYLLVVNRKLYKYINRQPLCLDEKIYKVLKECRGKMNIRTPIPVIYDSLGRTPYLFGYFRPKLLIPAEMAEKLSQEEIRHIFLHELTHLKRKDILINWIILLVQVMHWYNPVIWYAFYRMKQDCEMACDAAVLGRMSPKEYGSYGQTLINLVRFFSQSCSLPGTTGFVKKSQVKRRIMMISMWKKKSFTHTITASVIALLLIGIGLQTGCSITEKQKKLGFTQEVTGAVKEVSSAVSPVDKNKTVMEDFSTLVGKNAKLPEMIDFINKNITSVSKENGSVMVNKLEELQRGYLDTLSVKFYNGDVMQKKLTQQFKQGIDISKIETIEDKELKELLIETRDSGYRVETAEGYYFPIIDYEFHKKYSANVTPDIKEYIDLMAVESNKVPVKDAGLMISWDEILKRALNQEKFVSTYKSSVKANEVKQKLNQYITYILFGTNNTPVFSYDTKIMVPEAKNVYLNAVKNTDGSTVLKVLNGFIEELKKTDYKYTDSVDRYRKNIIQNTVF